jgi:glutamate/aspartate transport system substrate-binding protein
VSRAAVVVGWALALVACAVGGSGAAQAQPQASPTLRKIREAGVITLGYREASVPFSYLGDGPQPVGYSMAICDRIVDAVKARLGLRDLERRYVPVTTATRMPMVANGTVDLECGVTTNTAERRRQVDFTLTTFIASSRLVSRKTAPVRRLDDLRSNIVTSTMGTTSLQHLHALRAQGGLRITILVAKDDAAAFNMVETGQAAAYAMDDVLLSGSIATSRRPADYVISEESLSLEPYGIMLRKGDPEFKQLADSTIAGLYASGEIYRIYRQWFESPIPPRGINLQLAMHPAMRRVVEHPTDSSEAADYR